MKNNETEWTCGLYAGTKMHPGFVTENKCIQGSTGKT